MEDKYISKFVIASIGTVIVLLMFIMADSAYLSNAFAQTNETYNRTNRIINIHRTTASGENVTTDDDNNDNRIINTQRTTANGENVTTDDDNDLGVGNATALTNASIIGTNRIINTQRTTSTGENVTTDDDNDNDDLGVGNA